MDLFFDLWDVLEPQPRGLAAISIGGIAGGTAGFFTGGPAGAVAGYKAGEATEDKLKEVGGEAADAAGLSSVDKSALQQDTKDARAQRDAIADRLNGVSPYAAPKIATTTLAPVQQATGASVGQAPTVAQTTVGAGSKQNVNTPTLTPTQGVTATNIAAPVPTRAAQATAAQVGPAAVAQQPTGIGTTLMAAAPVAAAAKAAAATVAPITEATAPTVARTTLDTTQSDQVRAQQQAITAQLQAAAAGNGPSAAQALLQAQTDRAKKEQMGLAIARAHGGNVGLAQREANENIAQIESDANAQAAALRAKEQQDAQSKLADVLSNTRSQDINLTSKAADLGSAANLTEAQLASQTGLANLDVRSKSALEQAQLTQAAAEANAGRQQQSQLTAAQFQQEANKQNTSSMNDASKTQYLTQAQMADALAGRQQQVTLQQAQNQQQTNILNTQETNAAQQADAARALEAAKANQTANLSAATSTAQLTSTEKIEQAQLAAKIAMDNAGRELDALKAQAAINAQKGITDATLQAQIQEKQGELDAHMQEFNAAEANKQALAQGEITAGENKANQTADLTVDQLNAQREMGLVNAGLEAQRNILGADTGVLTAEQADAQRRAQITAGIIAGGSEAASAYLKSDKRSKKDIADVLQRGHSGDDELLDAFAAVHPVKFRYKDPSSEGARPGPQVGVLAQDLEKSPITRTVVDEKNGEKMIDTGAAVGLALAAIADIRKKMEGLKMRKGARR